MQNNNRFFKVGGCELIVGPMFAGKSSRLSAELAECSDIGLSCAYINHINDKRETEYSSEQITSHSSGFKGLSDKVDKYKVNNLSEVDVSKYDVVGIDEGQFFKDLNEIVRKWVLKDNKRVIVASLDGDFNMQPFGQVHLLMCLCEPGAITKLGARCKRCMISDTPYRHYRLVDAGYTTLNNNISVRESQGNIKPGGANEYQAVCMKCYQELNK